MAEKKFVYAIPMGENAMNMMARSESISPEEKEQVVKVSDRFYDNYSTQMAYIEWMTEDRERRGGFPFIVVFETALNCIGQKQPALVVYYYQDGEWRSPFTEFVKITHRTKLAVSNSFLLAVTHAIRVMARLTSQRLGKSFIYDADKTDACIAVAEEALHDFVLHTTSKYIEEQNKAKQALLDKIPMDKIMETERFLRKMLDSPKGGS